MFDKLNKRRMLTLDRVLVAVAGVLFFGTTTVIYVNEATPEWTFYQKEFKEIVAEKFGEDVAETVPEGVQQIWVEEIDVTDRCVTCHQGVNWKDLQNVEHPYKSHSQEILNTHPVSEFGCTTCHGGQGYATSKLAAHGFVKHWEEPLLGRALEEQYLFSDRNVLMEINCNECHRYERETKGMPYINQAKKLVKEKGCRACHKVNGRGNNIAPDLTYEGDKSAESFDYSRIGGFPSAFAWHQRHFKNPKELVEDSIMPAFPMNSKDIQALSMLVMSWKRTDIPVAYLPGVERGDKPTPEELEQERKMLEGPGAIFVEKQCFVCHSISSMDVVSPANIGPDLSNAIADVRSRFGRELKDFLLNPTGTMSVVLEKQIILTREEKLQLVEKLKEAYQKYLEQKEKEE